MRHRILLIGVLLPAALSHPFYGALARRDSPGRHEHRREHVMRDVTYDARGSRLAHGRRVVRTAPMRGDRCAVREVRVLEAPASGSGRIALEAGQGDFEMDAVRGLDRVEVEATLCASSRAALEQVGITLEPDGDLLRLRALEPPTDGVGYGRVDLTVRVPLGMTATVTDGRGGR
jgi:hypothetical protein